MWSWTERRSVRFASALVAVVGIGMLLAAQGVTYASFSDFHVTKAEAGAAAWPSELIPPVPAECAHITIDGPPIFGTGGDDTILGTNKNDLIFGLGGEDNIQGGNGDDCIVGGPGNDILGGDRQLENGQDVILGGADDDYIYGGNGKDLAYGGPGNDLIDGRNGKDLVYGGPGEDTLLGDNGTDLLHGGDSLTIPDTEIDTCSGGRAPDVYERCEIIDGVAVTP